MATPTQIKVPTALIPALRSALQSQGLSAGIIRDDGSVDPGFLIAAAYDTVEFRSAITPPVRVNTAELLSPSSPPNPLTKLIKPTVIVTGRAGKTEISPYGVPSEPMGWVGFAGVVGGLIGVGFLLGRVTR